MYAFRHGRFCLSHMGKEDTKLSARQAACGPSSGSGRPSGSSHFLASACGNRRSRRSEAVLVLFQTAFTSCRSSPLLDVAPAGGAHMYVPPGLGKRLLQSGVLLE